MSAVQANFFAVFYQECSQQLKQHCL